jgi:ankyrin repeat protein
MSGTSSSDIEKSKLDFFAYAESGDLESLKALLALHPEFLNAQDTRYKRTALIIAAQRSYSDILIALLDLGAEINAKDSMKETALMNAVVNFKKYPSMTRSL